MNGFSLGVIISTYNNPEWLEKTLWGYMAQTSKADEIIIADDGSRDETRLMIEKYTGILPIKHLWHEDKGFRKTKILNAALRAATADYLVFTDQDCIPRHDFLATHRAYARRGHFLSGGYFRLPMTLSKQLSRDDIFAGRAFSLSWLRSHGLQLSFKCTKLIQSPMFASIMNAITPTKATWNGMNSSGWRSDILAVRGFDERMAYGGEDREMGERMINSGLHPIQIRYSAVTLHLDHSRPYVNNEALIENKRIRKITKASRLTQTEFGL